MKKRFELADPKELIPIENFDEDRVEWLRKKVITEGVWSVPICVSDEGFIMDGHHRHQTSLRLQLKKVPIERFSYSEVNLYSLRDTEEVSYDIIQSNFKKNIIFPYKTAKHDFPLERLNFEPVDLDFLKE